MSDLRNILYIDDEEDLREVVTTALELDTELRVTSCASPMEGLAIANELRPDLILLDVMMPGMDGPTLLAALRQNETTASIPVIFITARVRPAEIVRFTSLGALGVVEKPFDPRTLSAKIRAVWAERSSLKPEQEDELDALQKRLAKNFAISAANMVRDMEGAMARQATGNPLSLKELAHRLAGIAGTLGFPDISQSAGNLELALDDGTPRMIQDCADALLELLKLLACEQI